MFQSTVFAMRTRSGADKLTAPFLFFMTVNLLCAFAAGQVQANVDVMRKSVVFLYGADSHGHPDPAVMIATGFIVQVPAKHDPKLVYMLLITAQHVVDPMWACQNTQNPKRLFLRLNKARFDPSVEQEGTSYLPLDITMSGKDRTVFTSADTSVDAAVIALNGAVVNVTDFDFNPLFLSDFPTPNELASVSAGDNIFSAALLPPFISVHRNYPILKFGHISAIPQERVQLSCTTRPEPSLLREWFVAASLVPGNSGSPVIYSPPLSSSKRALILGLVSMPFAEDIAGMTPAEHIFEIIGLMNNPDYDLYRGPIDKKP